MSVIESAERVEAAIAAFARGEIVVVTDDDDRENEGDLFVAASLCTPGKMAFVLRHHSRPRHRRRPGVGGRGATAAPRSHGGGQRRAARYRLHRIRRRPTRVD